MGEAGLFHVVEIGKMDSPSDRGCVKPELSAPLSCPRAQPQGRYQLPRAPPGCWFLTWMREVHFWLYDHPLGRQRGRVLAVGVDWSLELYCNTQQLVRKSSSKFYSTAASHTHTHPPQPATVTRLVRSAASCIPIGTRSLPGSQMLHTPDRKASYSLYKAGEYSGNFFSNTLNAGVNF